MIADRLAALREAATPGPWHHYRDKLRPQFSGRVNEVQANQKPAVVRWSGFDDSARPEKQHAANARYIVALVNAAPALEALVRAAEKVTERPGSYDSGGSQWWADHDALAAALAELEKVLG